MTMYEKRRTGGIAAPLPAAPSLWDVDAAMATRMLGSLLAFAAIALVTKTAAVWWLGAPRAVLGLYAGFGMVVLMASALLGRGHSRDASTVLVLGFWTMAMTSAVLHGSVLGPGTLVLMPTVLAAGLFGSGRFAAVLAGASALALLLLAAGYTNGLLPPPLIQLDAMRFWAVATASLGATVALCLLALRTLAERRVHDEGAMAPDDAQQSRLAAIGAATASVAHDLNNTLTVILSTGQLLGRKVSRQDTRQLVELLQNATDRATRLTGEMMRFAGGAEASGERLELDAVVREMEGMLRAAMPERVDLRIEPTAPSALVQAERVWLEQVLLNLAFNARDAIGAEGTVVIETAMATGAEAASESATRRDSYIRLRVADDGPGMDPDTAAQVFERQFSTKAGGGRGLGLSTVHSIVDHLGGEIHLETVQGRGARFDVYLPVTGDAGEQGEGAGELAASAE